MANNRFTVRIGENGPLIEVADTRMQGQAQRAYTQEIREAMVVVRPNNPLPNDPLELGARVYQYMLEDNNDRLRALAGIFHRSSYGYGVPTLERFTFQEVEIPEFSQGIANILAEARQNGHVSLHTLYPDWPAEEHDAATILRTFAIAGMTSVRATAARPDLFDRWAPALPPISTISASNQFGIINEQLIKMIWTKMRDSKGKYAYGSQWARNLAAYTAYQNTQDRHGAGIPNDPVTTDPRAAWSIIAVGMINAQFSSHESLVGWLAKKGKRLEDLISVLPLRMFISFCEAIGQKTEFFLESPSIYRYCHVMESDLLCEFSVTKFQCIMYFGMCLTYMESDRNAVVPDVQGVNLSYDTKNQLRELANYLLDKWGERVELVQGLRVNNQAVAIDRELENIMQRVNVDNPVANPFANRDVQPVNHGFAVVD
ncbi:MAG: nucleocapsid protein [Wufeng shrew rhabdovirus 9]|nr:MAG: nucleocapsid protein [Wufeng shrew rhabdovirus 9]